MKKGSFARLPRLSLAFAMVFGSTAAYAQESAQENNSGGLGDIVVTASKRETSAQSTPIALSAFDQATLAANGATDLRSLQNVAPTLQIGMSGTNTLLTIRGISSRDFTEIGDPAVAVSVDNFYIQRAAALNASVFDVERVEVLRGPQGTLYGRNATAGAININSVKPELGKVAGFGSIEYGNYNTLRAEGAINLPIGDKIAVRASFLSSSHDGYSNNSGVPRDGDDDDTQAARLHVLYKPTDRLSILLTGEYTKVGGVGPVAYGQPYSYTSAGTVDHGEVDLNTRRNWALNTPGSVDIEAKSIRGQISYDLDFATISYFGGYRKFIFHRVNDTDGTAINSNAGYLTFPQNENEDTQNHELRITSSDDGAFTWQGGVYYFKEQNDLLSFFGSSNTVPATYSRTFSYDVGAESKAAFAQVAYKLTDQLQFEGGIRYTEDSKYRVGYNIVNGVRTNQDSQTKINKVTWHAGVNAQITPRNLLYAKVDTGYKSGGFTDLNEYGPESVTAYEIGSKNRFLNNQLQFNLTGFYYDYKDLQVSQYREDARTVILNAGKAEIYGLEMESIFEPNSNDRIDFSANWLHARYTDFAVASGGVNVSYEGNKMIQSPDWSLAGGYQHIFDLGNAELTARVQSHYQTRSYFSYRNYKSESEGAFTKTDFTLNYAPNDASWSVLVYLRNIENKRVITDVTEYASTSVYRFQFSEPRTYGARLTYKF
jgi:iron complex outermembrane receptor protein